MVTKPMLEVMGNYYRRVNGNALVWLELFNSPGFVVLDEPNSNLDQEGDQALANALLKAKENKTTIVISHRKAIYDVIDKLMVIQNGTAVLYDDKKRY